MSIGQPHIIESVTISNAGGTTNAETYELNLVEGMELEEEARVSQVEAGETVQDGFDTSFTMVTYDLSILDDARVQYGATIPPEKARLVLNGAAGASSKQVDGIRLSGRKVFDNNRDAAEITATRTSATSIITLS